jgi:hypothetical protein
MPQTRASVRARTTAIRTLNIPPSASGPRKPNYPSGSKDVLREDAKVLVDQATPSGVPYRNANRKVLNWGPC